MDVAGVQAHRNGFGERCCGWAGPQPPVGDDAHDYVFRLYALPAPIIGPYQR